MFDTGLAEVEEALRAITVALDPDTVPGSMAQGAMERFARIEKMAHAGARLMGKRVADSGAWKNRGHQSPADAVADAMGCSRGEAQRELGTANKLADGLEATDQAARRGELSPTQTGHVADAAAVDPTAEADLLGLAATASAGELREEARRRRHAAARDDVERHRRIRRNRSLRMWSDDDGGARLSWSHLPELGAEIGAILDPYIEDQFRTARKAGLRERRDAYAADALVDAMRDAAAYRRGETLDDDPPADAGSNGQAEATGDQATHDTVGHRGPDHAEPDHAEQGDAMPDDVVPNRVPPVVGPECAADEDAGEPIGDQRGEPNRSCTAEPTSGVGTVHPPAPGRPSGSPGDHSPPGEPDPDDQRQRRRRSPRRRGADAKVIVRIDHQALLRGHTEAGEMCEIAGLGPVPVASVVALMDDAFLAAVITKGVDIVNVAHLGRRANALQTTALQANPEACTTLGCPNRARLEVDHADPYCDTLVTRLDGLDPSCGHCHHLKTYEGHRHPPGTGPRPLLSPAEQAAWNREHPDDPIAPLDPPGRRGPRFRSPSPSPTSTPPTVPQPPPTDGTPEPQPQALTLDL